MLIATAAQMRDVGARLARDLQPRDLLIASGPLGAGKTTLVQGIGGALGVDGEITSPTFVIAREHLGPIKLLHIDAYRLRPEGGGQIDPLLALDDLDLDTDGSVVVMEWGEGLGQLLSAEYLEIVIEMSADDQRQVTLIAHGERWNDLVERAQSW